VKHPRPLPRHPKTGHRDELLAILDRLEAARDIFRQNQELRGVLSRRETETRELRSRNAELEQIVRKFAPMLLDAATTMGLAAKNESLNRKTIDRWKRKGTRPVSRITHPPKEKAATRFQPCSRFGDSTQRLVHYGQTIVQFLLPDL